MAISACWTCPTSNATQAPRHTPWSESDSAPHPQAHLKGGLCEDGPCIHPLDRVEHRDAHGRRSILESVREGQHRSSLFCTRNTSYNPEYNAKTRCISGISRFHSLRKKCMKGRIALLHTRLLPTRSKPTSSARCTGAAPRYKGRREGWMLSVPCRGNRRTREGK